MQINIILRYIKSSKKEFADNKVLFIERNKEYLTKIFENLPH